MESGRGINFTHQGDTIFPAWLIVKVDVQMLSSALANLLQNAFKFTHPHSKVFLRAYAKDDRVLI